MTTDFKNNPIWEEAIKFHKTLNIELTKFPKEEQYAMCSQLRRASLSISSNIAEGSGRKSPREFLSYLNISMGSCKEVESILIMANELGYLTPMSYKDLNERINNIGKRLNGFMRAVENKNNIQK